MQPNTITHSRFFPGNEGTETARSKLSLQIALSDPTSFKSPILSNKNSAPPGSAKNHDGERSFIFPSVVLTDADRRQTVSTFSVAESRKNSIAVSRMSNHRSPMLHKEAKIEDVELQKELRQKTMEALRKSNRGSMFCHDLWDRGFYLSILKASGINTVLREVRKSKWQPLEYHQKHLEAGLLRKYPEMRENIFDYYNLMTLKELKDIYEHHSMGKRTPSDGSPSSNHDSDFPDTLSIDDKFDLSETGPSNKRTKSIFLPNLPSKTEPDEPEPRQIHTGRLASPQENKNPFVIARTHRPSPFSLTKPKRPTEPQIEPLLFKEAILQSPKTSQIVSPRTNQIISKKVNQLTNAITSPIKSPKTTLKTIPKLTTKFIPKLKSPRGANGGNQTPPLTMPTNPEIGKIFSKFDQIRDDCQDIQNEKKDIEDQLGQLEGMIGKYTVNPQNKVKRYIEKTKKENLMREFQVVLEKNNELQIKKDDIAFIKQKLKENKEDIIARASLRKKTTRISRNKH